MSLYRKARLLSVLFALGFTVMTGQSCSSEKVAYEAPDISQFISVSEEDGDGDGDGIKETRIRRYKNLAGDKAFSMTTGDRLWAWSLESHASGADPERNFVIRDSDCDGTFDERYSLDEEFHVPECLK
jgi:hypothetical protein